MAISVGDAYTDIKEANGKFEKALSAEEPSKDGYIRTAYHSLYQAASKANMLFLARKRKGTVDEGGLLTWARTEFDECIRVLYQTYYQQGRYPKYGVEEDFYRWLGRVKGYVNRLDDEYKLERSARPARGRRTDMDLKLDKEKILNEKRSRL